MSIQSKKVIFSAAFIIASLLSCVSVYAGFGMPSNNYLQPAEMWDPYACNRRDLALSFQRNLALANRGLVNEMRKVGAGYLYGQGVDRNPTEAVRWLRKAADAGDTEAMLELGRCYFYGIGVEKNFVEMARLFRKVEDKGRGVFELGFNFICYPGGDFEQTSLTEEVKWFRMAAEDGSSDAMFALGGAYYFGVGTEKNFVEAIKWFHKAAIRDNSNAMYYLGSCYYNGEGVEKNLTEAEKWLRKAAARGNRDAREFLYYIKNREK